MRYSRKNFYLVMPTIIITSVSSMLSFVSSSDIIPEEEKKILLIGVGVLTSIASLFQVRVLSMLNRKCSGKQPTLMIN